MLVLAEMLREVSNPVSQNRDLHLGRTCIAFVLPEFFNYFAFEFSRLHQSCNDSYYYYFPTPSVVARIARRPLSTSSHASIASIAEQSATTIRFEAV
jgi:hypothetical protein